MAKNWIQDAIKKRGAFKSYAKRNHESVLKAVQRSLSPNSKATLKTKQRANLAKTLMSMRKRKKG